jgi:GNAT superfamily N-acetyltransferase
MKTHHRPFNYESSDFKLMCALLVRDNASKRESFIWHVARLVDWKYNLFDLKHRFPGNYAFAAHLWFNYFDEMIGFVISEGFDNNFEIVVLEEYNYLYHEMLVWVCSEWGKQYSQLVTTAVSTHFSRIQALEQAGFKMNDDIEKIRIFDTSQFRDQPNPAAPLRFQSMAENKNYNNQTLLRQSAWPSHVDDKQADDATRAYVRTSPIYNALLDFVLVDVSGAHLAGCEAFVDRANNTAEIERVCTHTDHQNKGYSQMVLRSCMRVLHENGITTAYITGWNDKTIHLYGKLGHIKEFTRFGFERDMTG